MATKQPVRLYVFYHDDIDANTQRIVPKNYLKDCVIELQKVTGREFIIEYARNVPGVTDMNYKGNERWVLDEWIRRAREYADQHDLPFSKLHRYMLVTNDKLSETVLGVTYEGNSCLIASLVAYQSIAHELGHSFGATHEDAELLDNAFGATCETYVYPERSAVRANCYQYSLKNRDHIAAFLASDD